MLTMKYVLDNPSFKTLDIFITALHFILQPDELRRSDFNRARDRRPLGAVLSLPFHSDGYFLLFKLGEHFNGGIRTRDITTDLRQIQRQLDDRELFAIVAFKNGTHA